MVNIVVNYLLIERIINDIHSEVRGLKGSTDITWEVYQSDKRARRYVERTLHVLIEACIYESVDLVRLKISKKSDDFFNAISILTHYSYKRGSRSIFC